MYKTSENDLWNPAINALEVIKSAALHENESREAKFCVSHILPHFSVFESDKEPELLVDIPEWDNEDRISAMAYLMKLKDSAGITLNAFSELLKEWCATVFKRLHDPMVQNRILILQGGQGIGKDTWISMLLDGLGQFCSPLNIVSNDKDTFLALHDSLVLKISEYDKTSKTEVSTLKDIITTPATHLRAPYEKDRKRRLSRCSFISSANVDDLLRDYTGARRYMIFELESIEYAYEGWSRDKIKDWQAQCLAEMVHLASIDYKASNESWRQMREYLEVETPTDPAEDMVDDIARRLRKNDSMLPHGPIELQTTDNRIEETILQLSKETGIKPRGIKTMLRRRIGICKRIGNKRYWILKLPALDNGFDENIKDDIAEMTGQEEMNL